MQSLYFWFLGHGIIVTLLANYFIGFSSNDKKQVIMDENEIS